MTGDGVSYRTNNLTGIYRTDTRQLICWLPGRPVAGWRRPSCLSAWPFSSISSSPLRVRIRLSFSGLHALSTHWLALSSSLPIYISLPGSISHRTCPRQHHQDTVPLPSAVHGELPAWHTRLSHSLHHDSSFPSMTGRGSFHFPQGKHHFHPPGVILSPGSQKSHERGRIGTFDNVQSYP